MTTALQTEIATEMAKWKATSERMKGIRAIGADHRGFTAGTTSNPRDYTRAAILGAVDALAGAGVVVDVKTVMQAAALTESQARNGLRQARFQGLVKRTLSSWRVNSWEWELTGVGVKWLVRYRYLHQSPEGE
jgi:ribosome biogenesis protein Tsr3